MNGNILTPQLEKLITSLLHATETGAAEWLVTDTPETFGYAGHGGSVLIGKLRQGPEIQLRVLDQAGSVADSYSGYQANLERLFAAAERDAIDILRESPVVEALIKGLETAGAR